MITTGDLGRILTKRCIIEEEKLGKDMIIFDDDLLVNVKEDLTEKYLNGELTTIKEITEFVNNCELVLDDDDFVIEFKECDVMTEKIIEFECVHETAKFAGYVYAEEIDDDEPLYFYDRNYASQTSLTNAHFEGTEEDQIKLHEAFTGDFLFLQFLHDFQDEKKSIDRGNYIIHINGGDEE